LSGSLDHALARFIGGRSLRSASPLIRGGGCLAAGPLSIFNKEKVSIFFDFDLLIYITI